MLCTESTTDADRQLNVMRGAEAISRYQPIDESERFGTQGIRVNGINPGGVVRGSGIFASGWGAERAAVYGVEEDELGEFYAQRTLLKREVLPKNVANAVVAVGRRRFDAHDRNAHPGRRRCPSGIPAKVSASSPASDAAFVAVDLGASSGRVIIGRVSSTSLVLTEIHRFANRPFRIRGELHWDVDAGQSGRLLQRSGFRWHHPVSPQRHNPSVVASR